MDAETKRVSSNYVRNFRFVSTEICPSKILALFRNWKNKQASEDVVRIKNSLVEKLSSDNHVTLE